MFQMPRNFQILCTLYNRLASYDDLQINTKYLCAYLQNPSRDPVITIEKYYISFSHNQHKNNQETYIFKPLIWKYPK